jgi:hypothetical protein
LELHFLLGQQSASSGTPVGVLGAFEQRFQKYIGWTSHALERTSNASVPQTLSLPSRDWSSLTALPYSSGSIVVRCLGGEVEPERAEFISAACTQLNVLADEVRGSENLISFANGAGQDGVDSLLSLLRVVDLEKLAVVIRWIEPEGHFRSFVLDQRRAIRLQKKLNEAGFSRTPILTLMVQLAADEAAGLRGLAPGEGGFENLIRKLKENLSRENVLTLSGEDVERIVSYSLDYGSGGWQSMLRPLLPALRRAGARLADIV